jgi:hypothetical protein
MATKDPIVEAGILMAGVLGRIAMRPIGQLAASLREDGSRVAGPAPVAMNTEHGDEGHARRDHEVSFQNGLGGACPHRQMASVIIGSPHSTGQRCAATGSAAALSASTSCSCSRRLANSHRTSRACQRDDHWREAIVADAREAVRHRCNKEAPDEFVGVERHDRRPAAMAMILPAEGDAIVPPCRSVGNWRWRRGGV